MSMELKRERTKVFNEEENDKNQINYVASIEPSPLRCEKNQATT